MQIIAQIAWELSAILESNIGNAIATNYYFYITIEVKIGWKMIFFVNNKATRKNLLITIDHCNLSIRCQFCLSINHVINECEGTRMQQGSIEADRINGFNIHSTNGSGLYYVPHTCISSIMSSIIELVLLSSHQAISHLLSITSILANLQQLNIDPNRVASQFYLVHMANNDNILNLYTPKLCININIFLIFYSCILILKTSTKESPSSSMCNFIIDYMIWIC